MKKEDLEKIRNTPIWGVAERLGLSVQRGKCLCPFHDDHHASLSLNARRNTWRCFVCGASGGPIDLVMRHLHKSFVEACRWLADASNIIIEEYRPQTPSAPPRPFDASRYERYFVRQHLSDEARRFLFDERGIDERVVRWCRLTSWHDRQGTPWLQIPYYDREWRLIGLQNRNLVAGAQPRFRFPAGAQCSIYNLPVLQRLAEGDELYITEGCSDCWAMLSSGHKAIAIPSATLLKATDIEVFDALARRGITFHMYPDRDVPGEGLFLSLQRMIPGVVRHELPPHCKDYGEFFVNALSGRGGLPSAMS